MIPAAGGANRWLVARFQPCGLFALKVSSATSSVGRTLLVPTPYAVKMALVDAAFRVGWSDDACAELLRALVGVTVRIAPPARAVVSHTFLKIRQEPKRSDPQHPYTSSIAYREFVHHKGVWRWAFELVSGAPRREQLVELLPYVRYVGKRGSFVQFEAVEETDRLDSGFTQRLELDAEVELPTRAHVVPLDDFGPEATLDVLSSYSSQSARRDRHRVFVNTLVPLGVVSTGPGFTEYEGETAGE